MNSLRTSRYWLVAMVSAATGLHSARALAQAPTPTPLTAHQFMQTPGADVQVRQGASVIIDVNDQRAATVTLSRPADLRTLRLTRASDTELTTIMAAATTQGTLQPLANRLARGVRRNRLDPASPYVRLMNKALIGVAPGAPAKRLTALRLGVVRLGPNATLGLDGLNLVQIDRLVVDRQSVLRLDGLITYLKIRRVELATGVTVPSPCDCLSFFNHSGAPGAAGDAGPAGAAGATGTSGRNAGCGWIDDSCAVDGAVGGAGTAGAEGGAGGDGAHAGSHVVDIEDTLPGGICVFARGGAGGDGGPGGDGGTGGTGGAGGKGKGCEYGADGGAGGPGGAAGKGGNGGKGGDGGSLTLFIANRPPCLHTDTAGGPGGKGGRPGRPGPGGAGGAAGATSGSFSADRGCPQPPAPGATGASGPTAPAGTPGASGNPGPPADIR